MNGHRFNYDFGRKRNWRRWKWNCIATLDNTTRTALVLYMGGAQNYDFDIALEKGYAKNNLISVERDLFACREARAAGRAVIHGEFFSALHALIKNHHVGVIDGDFTGPITDKLLVELPLILNHPGTWDSVLSFNVMRGREQKKHQLMQFHEATKTGNWWNMRTELGLDENHRGFTLLNASLVLVLKRFMDLGIEYGIFNQKCRHEASPVIYRRFWSCARPKFATYHSVSGQVFDSVVFRNFYGDVLRGAVAGAELERERKDRVYKDLQAMLDQRSASDQITKRSVSAILAHLTMKQRRVGPYA